MAGKIFKAVVLTLCPAMALTLAGGCHDHDEEYFTGPVAVMEIVHFDNDTDGVPETRLYLVRIADEPDGELADEPPQVRLPDGTVLPAGCSAGAEIIVCETAYQAPPGGGTKAEILPGPYQVFNGDGVILTFSVEAADLAVADPAYAVNLTTAVPGVLNDPAVLDWDTAVPGDPGDYWRFRVVNSDGGDDDGQSVSGTGDWLSSDFSMDLPDNWDAGVDALWVEIRAVANNDRGDHLQVLVVEVVAPGYTLN
jgi:hypothetical protein